MNPAELAQRYHAELEGELRQVVGDSPLPLYHMMRYHLGWVDVAGEPRRARGGKLLRPCLCLLSCESVGGDWHTALPAAAALELVHNFSLIHDDIEDGDRERRGVPTVWHIWGQPQGINTGDAMHTLAHMVLLRLEEKGVAPRRVIRAAQLLDETCLRLCEGQYLDISYEERMDVRVDDYLAMIAGKTAALLSCSLRLGALVGTDDEGTIEHLARFGENLGMAFQIQDDVLGIWGESRVTGKPSGGDILRRKKTLPVIYGMEQASPEQKADLLGIYSGAARTTNGQSVSVVRGILDALGARQYATQAAGNYFQSAVAEMEKAEIPAQARDDLKSVASSLIGREY